MVGTGKKFSVFELRKSDGSGRSMALDAYLQNASSVQAWFSSNTPASALVRVYAMMFKGMLTVRHLWDLYMKPALDKCSLNLIIVGFC